MKNVLFRTMAGVGTFGALVMLVLFGTLSSAPQAVAWEPVPAVFEQLEILPLSRSVHSDRCHKLHYTNIPSHEHCRHFIQHGLSATRLDLSRRGFACLPASSFVHPKLRMSKSDAGAQCISSSGAFIVSGAPFKTVFAATTRMLN